MPRLGALDKGLIGVYLCKFGKSSATFWCLPRKHAGERAPICRLGVITGVTTFRYSGQDRNLYSADLGPVAQAWYERASAL
jgi:hypothetical protein